MFSEQAKLLFTLLVLGLCILATVPSPPAQAQANTGKLPPVVTVCRGKEMEAGEEWFSEPFPIGNSTIQGIGWHVVGTVSLNMTIQQSNWFDGPYAAWETTTLAGSTVTNDVTATSTSGGSDVLLAPSGWCRLRLRNSAGTTAGVTTSLFLQP